MFDPADPLAASSTTGPAARTDDLRPSANAIAGISGFGARPRLHPSWREPDPDALPDRPAPAAALILRLKDDPGR